MQTQSAFIIEVDDLFAGIIVRRPQGHPVFHFISAHATFDSLEGQRFSTPLAAERAVRDLLRPIRRPSLPSAA